VDFSGLLLLGFLWFLFNLLSRNRQQPPVRRPLPRDPDYRTPLPPAAPPSSGDPTQREGSRLEALLREFERALDQAEQRPARPAPAAGPLGRPAPERLPSAEEVEERESLEEEPEIVSLEEAPLRPVRVAVSQDEAAERVEVRRVAAAEARSGALTRADHLRFDQRIRQEPADATAVRGLTPEELRRAVVWREVLGPPKALRPDD
jgi:hypothetical protein